MVHQIEAILETFKVNTTLDFLKLILKSVEKVTFRGFIQQASNFLFKYIALSRCSSPGKARKRKKYPSKLCRLTQIQRELIWNSLEQTRKEKVYYSLLEKLLSETWCPQAGRGKLTSTSFSSSIFLNPVSARMKFGTEIHFQHFPYFGWSPRWSLNTSFIRSWFIQPQSSVHLTE